jgi:hypothetical protein
MNILIALAPIAMIVIAVMLSISAFYGGFHFANLRFLQKMKTLNDHIVERGTNHDLKVLNDFLIDINVQNNKAKFTDWIKWGMLGRNKQ